MIAPVTPLDPPETIASLQQQPDDGYSYIPPTPLPRWGSTADDLASCFRHNGWYRNRTLVLDSLKRTMQPQSRIKSFCQCGSHAYIMRSFDDPPQYRVCGSTCHDRFCVPCATERSRRIALNTLDLVGQTRVRFLTLTVRQTHAGLRVTLDHLLQSFRKLQATPLWKRSVSGGIGFIEIVFKPHQRTWNCHIHLLITGRYIKQQALSRLWLTCTGDSFIVHIMLPKGSRHVVKYITKYSSKPLNSSFINDQGALDEAILALKGRRLCTTFGGWRTVLVREPPADEAWENLGSLQNWIDLAIQRQEEALTILDALDHDFLEKLLLDHPQFPHPPPPEEHTETHKQLSFPGYRMVTSIR